MLTVPLDYAKPNGEKIKIALSEIKHKTSDAGRAGDHAGQPRRPGRLRV